jgi:pimeloyl-ACP methyl ester carboxylesterase
VRANASDARRRAKTARFLAGQIQPGANHHTRGAIDGLRHFHHPTLLLWGADDPHFGPQWAERLHADIPGAVGIETVDAGHLLMEERPAEVADRIGAFLDAGQPATACAG